MPKNPEVGIGNSSSNLRLYARTTERDVHNIHFWLRLQALRKRLFALHADQMADASISRSLMNLVGARRMLAASLARDAIRGATAAGAERLCRESEVSAVCADVCATMNRYCEMQSRDAITQADVSAMSNDDLDALLDSYLQSSRTLLIDLVRDEWEDLRCGGAGSRPGPDPGLGRDPGSDPGLGGDSDPGARSGLGTDSDAPLATHFLAAMYVCDYGDMQRMLSDQIEEAWDLLGAADRDSARRLRRVLAWRSSDGHELVPDVPALSREMSRT